MFVGALMVVAGGSRWKGFRGNFGGGEFMGKREREIFGVFCVNLVFDFM